MNVPLDADRLKAIGGPEEPLNVARRDARVADATRDGHIPFTRSKKAPGGAFVMKFPYKEFGNSSRKLAAPKAVANLSISALQKTAEFLTAARN